MGVADFAKLQPREDSAPSRGCYLLILSRDNLRKLFEAKGVARGRRSPEVVFPRKKGSKGWSKKQDWSKTTFNPWPLREGGAPTERLRDAVNLQDPLRRHHR